MRMRKLTIDGLPNLSDCFFFKWSNQHAKYHLNSVKMAFFSKKLQKSSSGWGLFRQILWIQRRQILALGSSPSPLEQNSGYAFVNS